MNHVSEGLGSAEQIIKILLESTDHIVHHRPGMTTPTPEPRPAIAGAR